jgi:ribosome-binding factor A
MDVHFKRTDRVAEQIQKSLAMLIQKSLKDPRLGMITVNEVRVTKDLAYADVYFSVFPDEHSKQTELLLSNASSFLRKQLALELSTRVTPKLRFRFDASLAQGEKITRALMEGRQSPSSPEDDELGV